MHSAPDCKCQDIMATNTVSEHCRIARALRFGQSIPAEETHSLPESQGLLQRKNEVLMPEVEGMNYEEKEQW